MRASVFSIFGAYVTPSSGCGTGVTLPAAIAASVSSSAVAPRSARASCTEAAGVGRRKGQHGAREDRAGIQALIHLHDRHAGFGIAGEDRALNGRGTAPARQERSVDVQAAVARQRQYFTRQQQPVGDDDEHLGRPALQHGARSFTPQRLRLRQGQRTRERGRLHRARLHFATAPLRTVRRGEDTDDVMLRAQRRERGQRKLRRTGKGDAQLQYARRAPLAPGAACDARSLRSLSSFLRMRSRFRSDR